jgi:TolB-like protein
MPAVREKSIAVLPFENLSEDKANAYFAEGIKDEILTKLASVHDLKVISRTSTAKYQSKPDNLKSVAQELGVSTVLEGAVQKAGDKVRVNVQLLDARADTHLWAKSYDRDLKDVLGLRARFHRKLPTRCKRSFRQVNLMLWPQPGRAMQKLTIFFCEVSMSFTRPRVFWPPTPMIVPTRLTGRRWHGIQILPGLLQRSRAVGYRATGLSLL